MSNALPRPGAGRAAALASTPGPMPAFWIDSSPAAAAPADRTKRAGAYVPEVDAVRGLAMSAVIAFHCGLAPFGWMGVWLFFVVSGFTVATSLLSSARRAPGTGALIRHFYARRALRIWPLYFAFVGLNVVVLLAIGRTGPLEDVPWLLTFAHNVKMTATVYTPDTSWGAFGHLWTLSVEQQFYLVFPLIFLVPGRKARGLVLLAVIVAAPVIRAAVGHWAAARGWDNGRVAFTVYVFAPAHFDAFAAGALIALFRSEIAAREAWARAAFLLAVAFTVLHVGIYLTLGVERVGRLSPEAMRNIVSGIAYGQGREISVYLIPSCFGVALLTGILSRRGWCLRFCRLPGLQAVGRVSYGGYLFHIPVLMAFVALVPAFAGPDHSLSVVARLGLFACAYPLTVGLAWLSFTFFEHRFLVARLSYG